MITASGLAELLQQGCAELGLTLNPTIQTQLLDYSQLLYKWNQRYNLTSIRKLEQIVIRHILDSLSIVPFIQGKNVIDVGTGAGLPGIPLALALPDKRFTLLDSRGKKINFLQQVQQELKLGNIDIVQARIEDYHAACYEEIIARALAAIPTLVQLSKHLLCTQGRWHLMKGQYPTEELLALPQQYIYQVYLLKVPGLNEQRHLVQISIASEHG